MKAVQYETIERITYFIDPSDEQKCRKEVESLKADGFNITRAEIVQPSTYETKFMVIVERNYKCKQDESGS